MNRASPALLRSALQAAHEMAKAGIMFVPMPVADEDEKIRRASAGADFQVVAIF